jgi:hypothetical protein
MPAQAEVTIQDLRTLCEIHRHDQDAGKRALANKTLAAIDKTKLDGERKIAKRYKGLRECYQHLSSLPAANA